jgi:Response regulator containing a CheY-like receiver domain and an HTH DNA-binding domain
METRVIIADDHSIVRMGLSSLIKQFNVQVVDEVATCNELMQALKNDT